MYKNYKIIESFKLSLKSLRLSVIDIFKFQALYRVVLLLILYPLLRLYINIILNISGYSVLINSDIKNFLISFLGILSILGLSFLAVYIVFYEFSIVLLIIDYKNRGIKRKLTEIMNEGIYKSKLLFNFSFMGLALYSLFLLPVLDLGLRSSLIPSFKIPDFIIGEIKKYPAGEYLVIFMLIMGIIIFSKLFLVLPIMVFEELDFDKAAKKSFNLTKGKVKALSLIIVVFLNIVTLGGILGLNIFKLYNNIFLKGVGGLLVMSFTALSLIIPPIIINFSYFSYVGILKERIDLTNGFKNNYVLKVRNTIYNFFKKIVIFINKYKKASFILLLIFTFFILKNMSLEIMYDYPDKQLIIGHRGSKLGVENSLESVINAKYLGADYAEIDILMSKDNVPMVIHDINLFRLTGRRLKIYDLTYEELSEIKMTESGYSSKIYSLEELLKEIDGEIDLLIELKSHGKEKINIVDSVLDIVDKYEYSSNILLQTTENKILKDLIDKAKHYKIGYIVVGSFGNLSKSNLSSIPVDFFVFEQSMVNKKLVNNIHRINKPIYVWTVNNQKQIKSFLNMEVDGIITDYPKLADDLIKEREVKFEKKY